MSTKTKSLHCAPAAKTSLHNKVGCMLYSGHGRQLHWLVEARCFLEKVWRS